MTQPPQSGPWGAQPPQQSGNWQGYPGGQHGPGPQGQWNPQQQWPNPAPAPQKKGPLKWVLGAIALIAVIAVTAVVAVSCAGGNGSNNGNGGGIPSPGSKSDIASANDTGPVSVITEDPSCAPWIPVNNIVADTEKNTGWEQRDSSIAASAWTPDMRALYNSVTDAMRTAADQTVPLVKLTPHRVLRELYQQYIAYTREFIARAATYSQADNAVGTTSATIGTVITAICSAINTGAAAARGPLVQTAESPSKASPIRDVSDPQKFLESPDSQCTNWLRAGNELTSNPVFANWLKTDSNTPASKWSPQDKLDNDAVKPVISHAIDSYAQLAQQSSNQAISDFGNLGVQYGRAFLQGLPTYTAADMNLYLVFLRAPGIITTGCNAVGVN